jgi:hypothetical protein
MNIFSFKLWLNCLQVGHTADGNIQVMGFSYQVLNLGGT